MDKKITDYSATVPLVDTTSIHSIRDKSQAADHNSTTVLSQTAFSNPQDFLKVIKKDFDRIAKAGSKQITKNDLELYSEHGADIEGRSAAAIAVKHYDQLQQMAWGDQTQTAIAKIDLDEDINLMTGNVEGEISRERNIDYKVIASGAVVERYLISGTVASLECPPLAIGLGVLAAGVLGFEAFVVTDAVKESKRLHTSAVEDQKMLKGWL